MFRYLLLLNLLFFLSEARENPFFPADGAKDTPLNTGKVENATPLKRAAITLPDTARLVKEVTVRYQNLDGSIDSRTISLEHSIDWQLPLFISQSYGSDAKTIPVKKSKPKQTFKKVADFKVVSFYQSGKKMKIKTGDKLLRHFMISEPYRIVMDFKKVTDIRSADKRIDSKTYKRIRLGNHDSHYRIVLELDKDYRYKITADEDGLLLHCY